MLRETFIAKPLERNPLKHLFRKPTQPQYPGAQIFPTYYVASGNGNAPMVVEKDPRLGERKGGLKFVVCSFELEKFNICSVNKINVLIINFRISICEKIDQKDQECYK